MPPVDDELLSRVVTWCAEAGRPATSADVQAALAGLGWDELIAVQALLADPPPARPLGPLALVDVARGVPPATAADRERQGQYSSPASPSPELEPTARRATSAPRGAHAGAKRKRGAGPFIRRARDRAEALPAEPARTPLVDELSASEGRAVLERLVRENGAQRGRIVAALASRWRRADGSAPGEDDLARLLDLHGLARGFERRERDEVLHALRASAGLRSRAAAALGLTPAGFQASLERLGATREAESIRNAHRGELRRRATLTERVRMLLGEAERLEDLGLLSEIEADVLARLPQHVRALRASGAAPLLTALARSLAAAPRDVGALAARLGIDLAQRDEHAPRRPEPKRGERGRPEPRPPRTSRTTRPRPRTPPGSRPARGPKRGSPPRRPGP